MTKTQLETLATEVMEISLQKGKKAIVDNVDYHLASSRKWLAAKAYNTHYAISHIRKENGRRTSISLHRVIMRAKKGQEVDHINGNGLDNRRSNLRICTRSENMMNTHARWGKSQYKGVCWAKKDRRWLARIKRKHIGSYINEEDAAKAYDKAAIKHFGEFANLNFPDERLEK